MLVGPILIDGNVVYVCFYMFSSEENEKNIMNCSLNVDCGQKKIFKGLILKITDKKVSHII